MMRRLLPALALVVLCLPGSGLCATASTGEAENVKPAVVKRELAEILSQPEYNRSYQKSWLDKALQEAGDAVKRAIAWFAKLFRFELGGGAGRLAAFIFAWLVVLAFLALLALVVLRVVRHKRGAETSLDEVGYEDYELPSAGPLIREARKLAETGDFRGAFRCAYLASISHLDEIKALRFERSRTNWEYLRDLASAGLEEPYEALRPLTMDFDRKFYGRDKCDEADYLKALGVYETVSAGGAP